MRERRVRLAVSLTREEHCMLEALAKRYKLTLAEVVRVLVREQFDTARANDRKYGEERPN